MLGDGTRTDRHAPISDISALTELTNLTMLFLDNNKISDTNGLKYLTKLSNLSLYGNPISNEQINELKIALPDCYIGWWG